MAVPTTEVTARTTDIPGLLIFDVTAIVDERGHYQEMFQKAKLVAVGLPDTFDVAQTNISYNRTAGATRGFHAEPWDKYIGVIKGSVFAAYVDLRQGDSFGKTVTVEITPTTCVYLPQGVGNSFQTLEDETYYLYNVTDFWSAELYDKYCFTNLADPAIGIDWPIRLDKATVSERDRNHPLLKDARKFVPNER